LAGFGPEFKVSCENHGGPGLGAVQQWDATAGVWNQISEFKASDKSVINPLIEEDSNAYAAENNIEEHCM
jgi:branched-chain amino acid transport system substrate-binding protein